MPLSRISCIRSRHFFLNGPVADREHLVGDEDVAVDVDGDREAEPGEHARGVVADRVPERPTSAKATMSSNFRVGLLLGHAEDRGVHVDVLAAGELLVEAGAGGDQPGDPAAGEDRAAVGLHHAADQLQQRALARAVEAHQPDRLPLLDLEGDAVEGPEGVADLLAAAPWPSSSA